MLIISIALVHFFLQKIPTLVVLYIKAYFVDY